MKNKIKYIFIELAKHLPFSIFGVSLGIFLLGLLTFISILTKNETMLQAASHELFHVFHPIHLLFSSIATTAMFWKHEKNFLKAILVGAFGSISICSLSDIVFPYVGGLILNADMQIHVCVFKTPLTIITFVAIGVIAGLLVPGVIEHATEYSHTGHVFISSASSILYLIGYGLTNWIDAIGPVFIITIISVMIPCCLSDIVFPLVCIHTKCGCIHEITKKEKSSETQV